MPWQDGPTDAAGGITGSDFTQACDAAHIDPLPLITENDTYTLLGRIGGLVTTGLTGTNVMDVYVVLASE